jgi:alpha-tubulin suppressor-like RCC1 family protein
MPRISALPNATTASPSDEFPIVQGAVTKRLTFNTARNSGLYLPAPSTISELELADNAVTAIKLRSSAVNNLLRAVGTDHIQDDAVTNAKMANDSVNTNELVDASVTNPKLAAGSLSISKFNTAERTYLESAGTARPGTAVIVSGSVENIVVYEAGSGYSSAPAVTITASPTGDNATATAVMTGVAPNQSVASVTVTFAGSGYTTNPTVSIAAPPAGTTALAYAYSITSGLSTEGNKNLGIGSDQAGFFITADKKVKAVGYNRQYKLAIGSTNVNCHLPMECGFTTNPSTNVVPHRVIQSSINTYVIDTVGRVWCAGYGANGANGGGGTGDVTLFTALSQTNFGNKPVTYLTVDPYTDSATVIVIAANKKAYGWGYNNSTQLGAGIASQLSPVAVGPGYDFSDAYTWGGASAHSLLIEAITGRVLCSGYNGYGQLSQGNATARTTLGFYFKSSGTAIGVGAEGKVIKAIGSGYDSYGYSVLLTDQGKVFTAGYNGYGQLGDGTTTDTSSKASQFAVEVMSSGAADIYVPTGTSSLGATFIKKTDGSLWAAGYNVYGNFGANGSGGALSATNPTLTKVWDPAVIGTTATKVVLAGGSNYLTSYVLGANGVLYGAGYNPYGQLPIASSTQVNAWTALYLNPGTSSIVDIRADSNATTTNPRVLMSNGKVYTSGYGANYSLGNSSTGNFNTFSNILF